MSSIGTILGSRAKATEKMECMWPGIEQLTPEQRIALCEFKSTMTTAMYRLYASIPVKTADAILEKFLMPIS